MQEIWSGKEQKGVLILVDEGRGRIESVSIWKHAANTYRDKMPGEGQSWFAGRFNFVCMRNIDKYQGWGFPDGSVIKNPPANAGAMGSTPDMGRSHVPRGNKACAPQLLGHASEPGSCNYGSPRRPLEPVVRKKRSTSMRSWSTTTRE